LHWATRASVIQPHWTLLDGTNAQKVCLGHSTISTQFHLISFDMLQALDEVL
jgi:hypothetical protein